MITMPHFCVGSQQVKKKRKNTTTSEQTFPPLFPHIPQIM